MEFLPIVSADSNCSHSGIISICTTVASNDWVTYIEEDVWILCKLCGEDVRVRCLKDTTKYKDNTNF